MALASTLTVGTGKDYTTIQAAIDNIDDGGTITIDAGTYVENLTIDKPVTLVTAGGEVIVKPGSGAAITIDDGVSGGDVTLNGISLDGEGTANNGIFVEEDADVGTLTFTNGTIEGFTVRGIYASDNGEPNTYTPMDELVVSNATFENHGAGSGNTSHIKLFGYSGGATFTNVNFVGAANGSPDGDRPDNAIEITGAIDSSGNAHPVPANSPDIDVTMTNVTVSGAYHKNPVALFHFNEMDGLSITGLNLSGATSSWGPLFNIDGVKDNVIDASGYGITFPATTVIQTELQGEETEQGLINTTIIGTAGNDSIHGKTGNDNLSGGAGNDKLYGGNKPGNEFEEGHGNDTLRGGIGNDELYGGIGTDTAAYGVALADTDIVQNGSGGWTVSAGTEGTDKLEGIEIVSHSGGRFLLVGNGGFTTFAAANAAATQPGDVVLSNTSNDNSDQNIDESGTTAPLDVRTGGGDDKITTGSGNDYADGGSGDDTIKTGAGDDTAKGGDGNDDVDTGDGNDTIIGGSGNGDDVYNGGLMNDTVVFSSAGSPIVVDLRAKDRSEKSVSGADGAGGEPDTIGELLVAAGYAANTKVGRAEGADIGTDALINIENVVAGARHDKVIGSSDANIVYGGAGNDTIRGNKGGDTLYGETGKDKIKGGKGKDTLDGGNAKDTLIGGKGKDTLAGGVGGDKLKGKAGKDTFVFNDIGKADKVTDFKPGKDMLAFDNDVFTGFGYEGALKDKHFTVGEEAGTKKQKLIYDDKTGNLWYDADGSKDGSEAVKIAKLKHAPDLSADDIFVI